MVAAEPGGPVELEARSLLLWAVVFAPGVVLAVAGLTLGSWLLLLIGFLLVMLPLAVQLFVADWGDVG
jgi:hypothetical protein